MPRCPGAVNNLLSYKWQPCRQWVLLLSIGLKLVSLKSAPHALIPPLRAHTAQAPEDQSWKPRIIQMCSGSSEYCGDLSLGMLGRLPNTIL